MSAAQQKPLTPSLLRAHTEAPVRSIPVFNRLFESASEGLANILARLNEVQVRVALDGIEEASVSTKQPHLISVSMESTYGPLDATIACDRSSCFTFCELSLGGTGTEPAFDCERPLSKIETQLQKLLLDDLAKELPGMLAEVFDSEFNINETGPANEPVSERTCISGKLLVNAFGYSGEVQLSFDRKQIYSLAEKSKLNKPGNGDTRAHSNDMREQVEETELLLEVSLPAETVAFAEIGELRPGQLLKLSATTSTPLTISCDGKRLFSALLARSSGRVSIRVVQ